MSKLDISKLKIGQKVHYIPFEGCDPSKYENGMVKSIPENFVGWVYVVYKCAGDWEHFEKYTGVRTAIKRLQKGWYHG